jgi:hypothetical protein
MSGADKGGAGTAVAECTSQLLDERHQRRVGHECARPQAVVQLVFSNHAGRFGNQQNKQIERLGRQVDLDIVSRELPTLGIEHEGSEARGHKNFLGIVLILPLNRPDLRTPPPRSCARHEAHTCRVAREAPMTGIQRASALILLALNAVPASPELAAAAQRVHEPFTRGVRLLRSSTGDPKWKALMTWTAAEMLERSPTFAELMDRVATAPGVLVYIEGGRISAHGLIGRSRFEITPSGTLIGRIEIDEVEAVRPSAFDLRVRGLAHELAHAYEVICLRLPQHDTTTLRDTLAARASIETRESPFARAVEDVIIQDWFERPRTPSRLKALARHHDLNACGGRDGVQLSGSSSPSS